MPSTGSSQLDSRRVVNEETLEETSELPIFDEEGNEVPFASIFADTKTIVVFVRHFFCGMCQAYISQLSSVPQQALSDAGVKVAVIGCGDWQLIKAYKKNTDFKGEIYADPSRNLYHKLGMTIETLAGTPKDKEKRSYVTNALANVLKSIWKGPLLNPHHLGKQGNLAQLGGDFVFGPGKTCTFAHIMEHTQDHVEVSDLMKAAAVNVTV